MADNIIEFNRARVKKLSNSDKRMHPRLESDDRLFTQVVLAAGDPELVGATLS